MCIVCDILVYIGNNFRSILQTILWWVAIYFAVKARDSSQEQLKEMREQFKTNTILQGHRDRYQDLSRVWESFTIWEWFETVKESLEKWWITMDYYENNIKIHIDKINELRILSLVSITNHYQKEYPDEFWQWLEELLKRLKENVSSDSH